MTPPPSTEGLIERLRDGEMIGDDFADAADLIERQSAEIEALCDVVSEHTRVGVPGPPDDGLVTELRAERDALLQKPVDLAKMDSVDDDATDRMIAYYWWQQAQDAREALARFTQPKGGSEK